MLSWWCCPSFKHSCLSLGWELLILCCNLLEYGAGWADKFRQEENRDSVPLTQLSDNRSIFQHNNIGICFKRASLVIMKFWMKPSRNLVSCNRIQPSPRKLHSYLAINLWLYRKVTPCSWVEEDSKRITFGPLDTWEVLSQLHQMTLVKSNEGRRNLSNGKVYKQFLW